MGTTFRLGAILCAFLLAGCATAPAERGDRIGRIYSYLRSNRDGSEVERIHVYRASRTRIEVTKMRERCTDAAFVTAELDLTRGQATRLTGGRLTPGAGHEDFGRLSFEPATRRLEAVLTLPDGERREAVQIADEPWHLYDFDLASLTVTAQYRPDRRAGFSFGLALILVGEGEGDFLSYLGRADARFAGEERYLGRAALRFEVGGPAFGDRGGPLWFDAVDGHILGASWGIPNHSEYRDFELRLTGVGDGGAAQWRRLLTSHFEGCAER